MKACQKNYFWMGFFYFEPRDWHEKLLNTCVFQRVSYISSPGTALKACKNMIWMVFSNSEPRDCFESLRRKNCINFELFSIFRASCHKRLWKRCIFFDFLIFWSPGIAMEAYKHDDSWMIFWYLEHPDCHESLWKWLYFYGVLIFQAFYYWIDV